MIGLLRLVVAPLLLIPGLVLAAGAGVAQASPAVSHTIASAESLAMDSAATGGGGAIDFWKVDLYGGDQVQFAVTNLPASTYVFSLYAPGTTDGTFRNSYSLSSAVTDYSSGRSVIDVQAPYTGTFVLAVCENVSNNNCGTVGSGNGNNPMDPYTFTPTLVDGGVSGQVAGLETPASPVIAQARSMGFGDFESGGGNLIDFWRMGLSGGDQVQFAVTNQPTTTYVFSLYAPGTTDGSFQNAPALSSAVTNYSNGRSVIDVQAPYTGTFVLAVCENVSNNNCGTVDSGSGNNPMAPYTFTPTLVNGGVSHQVAGLETAASPVIAHARGMGLGDFESGGGRLIDFWKVALNDRDRVQFSILTPPTTIYVFSLYAPGTTDASFPAEAPVSSGATNYLNGRSVIDLQAPYDGTFVLAVCENVSNNDCGTVAAGSGNNPMEPYTFTPLLFGGYETSTSLHLSAATVTYGREKSLKFSVVVKPLFGGTPDGQVAIEDGKLICLVKLSSGRGNCSVVTETELPVGKHSVVATYTGNYLGSQSTAVVLTVAK